MFAIHTKFTLNWTKFMGKKGFLKTKLTFRSINTAARFFICFYLIVSFVILSFFVVLCLFQSPSPSLLTEKYFYSHCYGSNRNCLWSNPSASSNLFSRPLDHFNLVHSILYFTEILISRTSPLLVSRKGRFISNSMINSVE